MIAPEHIAADEPVAEPELWLEAGADDRPGPGEAFLVDVDGFEGPLDLLLALARTQKVDLAKISILALVDQYLEFIADARKVRLELAADYLVMAAWLAFLKSKLILPRVEKSGDEPTGEELAARLAFRLMRLNAMREAAAKLMTRKRLGHDVFARGLPEGTRTIRETKHTATVHDLLKAYAEQRQRRAVRRVHTVEKRTVWSIKEARQRLERLVGERGGWVQLDFYLERYLPAPGLGRTVLASSFGASLEMAREGLVELRQSEPFAPIYVRRRESGEESSWERIG
jgi:segregation and condensation protein A